VIVRFCQKGQNNEDRFKKGKRTPLQEMRWWGAKKKDPCPKYDGPAAGEIQSHIDSRSPIESVHEKSPAARRRARKSPGGRLPQIPVLYISAQKIP